MRNVTSLVAGLATLTLILPSADAQPGNQPTDPYAGQPVPPPPPITPPPNFQLSPQPLVQPSRSHLHDGAVIADFSVVGTMAAIDILLRQDVDDGSVGTLIILAGVGGGGALGYLLANKFDIDAGTANATTIGLIAGIANGALLVEPTGIDDGEGVMGLLFLGSAIGATGGFLYGHGAHLTSGQSTFIGNAVLLGSATAALTAIAGSDDGSYGGWENGTLALGLDGGILAGALIAPHLDWSPRRARVVMASTVVGALAGGMLAGLTTKKGQDDDYNGDLIAACMTGGLWGGFAVGILVTRDSAPDPAYLSNHVPAAAPGASTSFAPWIGDKGQRGILAGGTW